MHNEFVSGERKRNREKESAKARSDGNTARKKTHSIEYGALVCFIIIHTNQKAVRGCVAASFSVVCAADGAVCRCDSAHTFETTILFSTVWNVELNA